jgi:hypothetical protein
MKLWELRFMMFFYLAGKQLIKTLIALIHFYPNIVYFFKVFLFQLTIKTFLSNITL